MLRTITISSCVSVQGIFLRDMPDGRVVVQVDDSVFAGKPVSRKN